VISPFIGTQQTPILGGSSASCSFAASAFPVPSLAALGSLPIKQSLALEAATDYWANLVGAGNLRNATVCNICITSELPVILMYAPW
jgi:hypothetical protein